MRHMLRCSSLSPAADPCLTGATPILFPQERRELSSRIAAGAVDLVIGTTALTSQSWAALGLVVIDEQHK